MKKAIQAIVLITCAVIALFLMTACGSEAKRTMEITVESANELLAEGEVPFDPATKEELEKVIASAAEAEDDKAYNEVTSKIEKATEDYRDSVKQLKQVTNPEESFLVERAKTVDKITKVEAATEDTDVNNLMNKPGGYTSYVAMQSSLVEDEMFKTDSPVEYGCDGGAVIEAFNTPEEAKAREEYLAGFDTAGVLAPGTHTVLGTLVVRTSNQLKASQQKELEKNIIDALIRLDE